MPAGTSGDLHQSSPGNETRHESSFGMTNSATALDLLPNLSVSGRWTTTRPTAWNNGLPDRSDSLVRPGRQIAPGQVGSENRHIWP